MTMVWTIKGPVSIDLLRVQDIITIEGGFRKIVTQWYFDREMESGTIESELVRQDCNVNCLMPMDLNAKQQENT